MLAVKNPVAVRAGAVGAARTHAVRAGARVFRGEQVPGLVQIGDLLGLEGVEAHEGADVGEPASAPRCAPISVTSPFRGGAPLGVRIHTSATQRGPKPPSPCVSEDAQPGSVLAASASDWQPARRLRPKFRTDSYVRVRRHAAAPGSRGGGRFNGMYMEGRVVAHKPPHPTLFMMLEP